MTESIKEAFPDCSVNGCLEFLNATQFFVIEVAGKSVVVKDGSRSEYPFFKVENLSERRIGFLAIDHCLLFNSDHEKCDFALFNDFTFVFVEMKASKKKQGNTSRDKAYSQLLTTIEAFVAKKVTFGGRKLVACMCVGLKSPTPSFSAKSQSKRLEIWNRFKADLVVASSLQM